MISVTKILPSHPWARPNPGYCSQVFPLFFYKLCALVSKASPIPCWDALVVTGNSIHWNALLSDHAGLSQVIIPLSWRCVTLTKIDSIRTLDKLTSYIWPCSWTHAVAQVLKLSMGVEHATHEYRGEHEVGSKAMLQSGKMSTPQSGVPFSE